MSLRVAIPYGYEIIGGRYLLHEEESKIVKYIFEQYIEGANRYQIASALKEQSIPYTNGECRWNDGTIARMLRNQKYVGTDLYPPIITADELQEVQRIEKSKEYTYTSTPETKAVQNLLVCDCCGNSVKRKMQKWTNTIRWYCTAEWKHVSVKLCDDDIFRELREFKHHTITKYMADNSDLIIRIKKAENELNRLMSQSDADSEELQTKISTLASLRYDACEKIDCTVNTTLQALEDAEENYNLQRILRGVKAIKVADKAITSIELKDGTILRKGVKKDESNKRSNCNTSNH